jgi:phage tail sheath protein FI
LIGSDSDGSGLFALNQISIVDLICLIPDKLDLGPVALLAAERFCRKRYAMLVIDPPSHWKTAADAVQASRQNGFASANVMTYFPRPSSLEGDVETEHASVLGAIVGRLAAGDAEHGVWGSFAEDFAGDDRICIRCRARLTVTVDNQDRAILARSGVNCLRDLGAGILELSGLVTFAHGEDVIAAWDDLRKRRIALFVIENIARATRWAAFQDDDTEIWTALETQITDFLRAIFDAGALAGRSVEDACYMIRDGCPDDGAARIKFIIGIALDKNGFLAFRFTHDRVDCEVREVAWQPGMALAS